MAATYSSLVGLAVGGKYEVRRVMGAGGMGVVCEAIHRDLGKKVAIKLIDKSMKESDLIVARFRVEAKALGSIQSEHIVEVFDVEADSRVGLYMVMEHLVGEDLQTRLEREKPLDVKTCVMIAHQIARGLTKAHAAGVIHRDLKPANVFLTQRDNGHLLVKLLDFGVSKLLADEGGGRITGAGAPIGTPLYMSPEQAEGKDDTDARADIWSLGALMYEALSGTPPFQDRGSYHGTIVGILTSRPKLLHDAAPWVPAELARVVDAMLVHDRDARIKDAAAVTQRLLEAYPAVLPDGTGRHTAVIVPQATAAVDATGDTDFFSSAGMPAEMQRRSRPTGQDSSRTVPEVSTGPGVPQTDATRTAAATPVDMGRSSSSAPPSPPLASGVTPKAQSVSAIPSSGTKTEPMPWGGPTSSAGGVAMPGTPPVIDPLPASQMPDTMRDDVLARRAERRRWLGFAGIAIVIAGVAAGGYVAGRRASEKAAASSTATTPAPSAVTTATATASVTPTATATATATAAATTTASVTPEASAKRPAPRKLRAPPHPAATETTTEGPPKDTPPTNPYDTPPP